MVSALVSLLLLLPLSSSNATTPCSPSDTSQLDSLAASRAGLLRVCHNDAGFDLYPFTGFPPADKATIVCFGRACPSVIYDLQHAALPNCTVDVQGQAMTPAEYLRKLCPSDAPPATTTATAPPRGNNATTTPTPGTSAPASPTTTTATTPSPSATSSPPAATTDAPSGDEGSTGSSMGSTSTSAPPSVETPTPSSAASVPTTAPSTPASDGLTRHVATSVVLLAVAAPLLQ